MFLVAAFEGNMSGNEHVFLEDLDRVGEHVNVEDAASRRIGDAIEIAADAHHALMRDAPFELQDRSVWDQRQRLQTTASPRRRFR